MSLVISFARQIAIYKSNVVLGYYRSMISHQRAAQLYYLRDNFRQIKILHDEGRNRIHTISRLRQNDVTVKPIKFLKAREDFSQVKSL